MTTASYSCRENPEVEYLDLGIHDAYGVYVADTHNQLSIVTVPRFNHMFYIFQGLVNGI
ncbi:hypothetical protein SERLA73DRAFT_187689 [Serpula lacrymans var. lacrymans S7.3]|uniref:Uncharacterized protein n=2 Tax=Serpula lacrymans var. lacrymans TaxID=341189 RepID=F8QA59_SERL3|nr:uncharacterized protein SERLADRAFT_477447 [Serpula lacrymans var. lacrymans S7.9]EGN94649.1 hypothetical protein SERLA73DRAFT_187689 [Serpula lacrymans var. lacrymans S7.3]EGO20131.1 hypothetical protein SERLADRAFT_477447 [Serpula lacrymans var. lacrymans S7.9]